MLTLQSSQSWIVCLLIFKVNQDSHVDVILLASQGVSFTEVQEGLIVRRGVSALRLYLIQCTKNLGKVLKDLKHELFPS